MIWVGKEFECLSMKIRQLIHLSLCITKRLMTHSRVNVHTRFFQTCEVFESTIDWLIDFFLSFTLF
jgi:hypothetical protein